MSKYVGVVWPMELCRMQNWFVNKNNDCHFLCWTSPSWTLCRTPSSRTLCCSLLVLLCRFICLFITLLVPFCLIAYYIGCTFLLLHRLYFRIIWNLNTVQFLLVITIIPTGLVFTKCWNMENGYSAGFSGRLPCYQVYHSLIHRLSNRRRAGSFVPPPTSSTFCVWERGGQEYHHLAAIFRDDMP